MSTRRDSADSGRVLDDLEEKVSESLKRFDQAIRATTRPHQQARQLGRGDGAGCERGEEDIEELANRIAAEEGGDKQTGTARCRPWDYNDFTGRLRTFTPLNWFAKPSSASPPLCARFGWINRARDTLACQCCAAQLLFVQDTPQGKAQADNNDDNADAGNNVGVDDSAAEQLAQPASFLSRLASKHHHLCPWQGNPCPKDFLHLPPMTGEDWRTEFLLRMESILPLSSSTLQALPEASLPAEFEQHCVGGLKTLATEARALQAKHIYGGRTAAGPGVATTNTLTGVAGVNDEDLAKARTERTVDDEAKSLDNDNKRLKSGDASENSEDSGENSREALADFRDMAVGTAAAIAVFGWQSASAPPKKTFPQHDGVLGSGDNHTRGNYDTAKRQVGSADGKHRLWCALCNRRVLTDNFLAVEVVKLGNGGAASDTHRHHDPAELNISPAGAGRGTKRRRVSGGGTPLKAMDLAGEHRSFCPWATVHPNVEGDTDTEGAETFVPGWRQALDAVLRWEEGAVGPTKQGGGVLESEPFGQEAGQKAEEALHKVQRVLNVLMTA